MELELVRKYEKLYVKTICDRNPTAKPSYLDGHF
jgi:hypothetical protein